MKKVEDGLDPIAVVRDAMKNERIDLPNEKKKHHNSDGFASFMLRTHAKYSPIAKDLVEIFEGAEHPGIKEAQAIQAELAKL
jgi:5,5'-dehydrodivanillate O-demethylase